MVSVASERRDQHEAGEQHDRAGHAMNRDRCNFSAARQNDVGHVAERDDGENKDSYAYGPAIRGEHQGTLFLGSRSVERFSRGRGGRLAGRGACSRLYSLGRTRV